MNIINWQNIRQNVWLPNYRRKGQVIELKRFLCISSGLYRRPSNMISNYSFMIHISMALSSSKYYSKSHDLAQKKIWFFKYYFNELLTVDGIYIDCTVWFISTRWNERTNLSILCLQANRKKNYRIVSSFEPILINDCNYLVDIATVRTTNDVHSA